jgi:hypothetical protein
MKSNFSAIVGPCSPLLAFVLTHAVQAQNCTPASTQTVLAVNACTFPENINYDQNYKVSQFNITWPDAFKDTRNNNGYGQCFRGTTCTAAMQEIDCWAQFDNPVGLANGSWSQSVHVAKVVGTRGTNSDGQECYTFSCGLTGFINKASDSHTCSSCPTNPSCNTRPIGHGTRCPDANGQQNAVCDWASPDPCKYSNNNNCPNGMKYDGSCCYFTASPIILDLEGSGFDLTDEAHGVRFQIFPDLDQLYMVAWPTAKSNNAWLVLDRNGDGVINDFSELFGNLTPQPEPPAGEQKNGFLALAVFDRPDHGGNGDGWISDADAIFTELRVWQDANHDGISQPDELKTLEAVGIKAISLQYTLSTKTDPFDNVFRYRGRVLDTSGSEVRKVIYDVLVGTAPIQ